MPDGTMEAVCSVCESPGPHEFVVTYQGDPPEATGREFTCANPDCWQVERDDYGNVVEGGRRWKTTFWYPL